MHPDPIPPRADDAMRIGDADRTRMLDLLQEHLAAGRLSLAEFEERSAEAIRARTRREGRALFADLPAEAPGPADAAAAWPRPAPPDPRGPARPPAPRTVDEIVPPGGPGSRRHERTALMALAGVAWLALADLPLIGDAMWLLPAITAILLYVAKVGPPQWYLTEEQRRALDQLEKNPPAD